jgi:hypothetical protein
MEANEKLASPLLDSRFPFAACQQTVFIGRIGELR